MRVRFDSVAARYESSLPALLLLSGLGGAALGIAGATYQAALEPAQVLIGSVSYDPASPIYGMHMAMFTLVNYVLWFFLALTRSEAASSIIICALTGAVAMQCLAMAIFLGVRNLYIAFLASIVAALLHLYGHGISYPILLFGTAHTNGRIGFFFPLFAVLLFSFSRFRLAFFLCGLSLMVHPSWGIWFGFVIFLVLVTGYRGVKPLVTRVNIGAYFAGVGISLAALILHKLAFPILSTGSAPTNDSAARQLFYNYIRYWDFHRQRFDNPGVLLNEMFYAAITLAICIIIALRRSSSAGEKLFARLMIIGTIVSAVFVFVPSWFAPDAFPQSFVALMPGRFINASLFLAIPMLIGFLLKGRFTVESLARATLGWLAAFYLMRFFPVELPIPPYELAIVVATAGLAAYAYARPRIEQEGRASYTVVNRILAPLALAALIVGAPYFVWRAVPQIKQSFVAVSIPPGTAGKVLVTFENYLLQAEARVPTITPVMDGYPYSKPAALIGLNRELSDIYGVSLLTVPKTSNLHRGGVITADYADLWKARSCKEWEQIAARYHFGLIVTPADMKLQLPRADQDPAWNKFFPRCESR